VVTRRRDTRQDNLKSEHASGNPPSPTRVMVTRRAELKAILNAAAT
jgi:hypothetical protein